MKKLGSVFGWNKKKAEEPEEPTKKGSAKKAPAKRNAPVAKKGTKAAKAAEVKPKKSGWW